MVFMALEPQCSQHVLICLPAAPTSVSTRGSGHRAHRPAPRASASLCPQCLHCHLAAQLLPFPVCWKRPFHLVSCFKGSSWSPLRPWVHMPFPASPAGCATLTHSACTLGCRDLLAAFNFLYFPKKLVLPFTHFLGQLRHFSQISFGFLKVAFGYFFTSLCV